MPQTLLFCDLDLQFPNLCTVSLLLYLMVLKTIFPGISDAIFRNCVISIDSYSPVNKFYSFIIVSPDEIQGYLGFSMVTPPPPQRFPFRRNNLKIF